MAGLIPGLGSINRVQNEMTHKGLKFHIRLKEDYHIPTAIF